LFHILLFPPLFYYQYVFSAVHLTVYQWLISALVPAFSLVIGFVSRFFKCKYESDPEEETRMVEEDDVTADGNESDDKNSAVVLLGSEG
jgi:hypothetical protein